MPVEHLINIATISFIFLPSSYFLWLLSIKKVKDTEIFALGTLLIIGTITELIGLTFIFYGIDLIENLESFLSYTNIWKGNLIQTIGFKVIGHSIANRFIYNYYFLVEFGFFLFIVLSWKKYSIQKRCFIIGVILTILFISNTNLFKVSSIESSRTLITIEHFTIIITGCWTFLSFLNNNRESWSKIKSYMFIGILCYSGGNILAVMYGDMNIGGLIYFRNIIDVSANIIFYFIFYKYNQELKQKILT